MKSTKKSQQKKLKHNSVERRKKAITSANHEYSLSIPLFIFQCIYFFYDDACLFFVAHRKRLHCVCNVYVSVCFASILKHSSCGFAPKAAPNALLFLYQNVLRDNSYTYSSSLSSSHCSLLWITNVNINMIFTADSLALSRFSYLRLACDITLDI